MIGETEGSEAMAAIPSRQTSVDPGQSGTAAEFQDALAGKEGGGGRGGGGRGGGGRGGRGGRGGGVAIDLSPCTFSIAGTSVFI